jgi:hypothetical protein
MYTEVERFESQIILKSLRTINSKSTIRNKQESQNQLMWPILGQPPQYNGKSTEYRRFDIYVGESQ